MAPGRPARRRRQRHHDAARFTASSCWRRSRPTPTPRPSRSSCCRPRRRPADVEVGLDAGRRRLRHQAVRAARPGRPGQPRSLAPDSCRDPMIRDSLATALARGPRRRGRRAARRDPPRAAGPARARRLVVQRGPGHGQGGRPQPARAGRRARRRASSADAAGARRAGRDRRPGLRELPPRDDLAPRRARRRRRRRRGRLRPPRPRRRHDGSTSSSCRPTPPARSTPATAGGAAYGDALARSSSARGYAVHREYYLNDRGAQMRAVRGVARGPQGGRRACPRAATRASTSPSGPPRCPTTPTRWSGATSGRSRDHARERSARIGRRVRHVVQRAVARRQPARSTPTLADLRDRGRGLRGRTAPCGCAPPTSATTRTACSSSPTASPPTCCPTSPTTATSSPAASTCSSTCGAPTTTATCARMKAAIAGARPRPRRARGHPSASSSSSMRGGEAVRLSKRTGDLVELDDLLDEVGADAARLTYLLQSIDTPQTVDLDLVTAQSMENPVFYVQIAHARIRSHRPGGRRAGRRAARRSPTVDLVAARPRARARACCARSSSCPRCVALAARDRAPHKVTTWVRELADRVPRLLPRLLRDR